MPSKGNRYGFRVINKTTGTILKEHILTINPQELLQPEMAKATVTETFGNAFLDTAGRARSIPLNISGNTGYRGKERFVSGKEEFMQLRDMVRTVNDETDAVIFDNYEDNEHYVVTILNFQLKRSSNRPMTYDYSIQMQTLGAYDKAFGTFVDKLAGYFNDVSHFLEKATATVRDLQNTVTENAKYLTNSITGMVYSLNRLVDTVTVGTVKAYKELEWDAKAIANIPKMECDRATKLCDDIVWNLRGTAFELQDPIKTKTEYETMVAITKMKRELRSIRATLNIQQAAIKSSDTSLYIPNNNETLQEVALKTLGDFTRWTEIAQINNLQAGQKIAGLTLRLPDAVNPGALPQNQLLILNNTGDKTSGISKEEAFRAVFGSDIKSDAGVSSSRDLATVSGLDCIRQSMENRLKTRLNEIKAYPTFGNIISEIVGSPMLDTQIKQIALEVKRSLLSDPRVTKVENISVTGDGETVTVQATAILLGEINMPIGTTI